MKTDANPVWLIETEVFAATAARLIEALERAGTRWQRFADGMPAAELPGGDACVVFYGSLNAAAENRDRWSFRPGAICAVDELHCSRYYAHHADVLLNEAHVFTTAAELVADPARIVAAFGDPERVFVRPDSPLKPFSGRVVPVEGLTLEALDHGFYYEDENLPVVVSPLRDVGREWRFVVTPGRIVATSSYEPEGRAATMGDVPDGARALAQHVADGAWHPDPIYVVDVCEADDGYRLLELNSFSCSDLYCCDFDAVVAAVDPLAVGLWRA